MSKSYKTYSETEVEKMVILAKEDQRALDSMRPEWLAMDFIARKCEKLSELGNKHKKKVFINLNSSNGYGVFFGYLDGESLFSHRLDLVLDQAIKYLDNL